MMILRGMSLGTRFNLILALIFIALLASNALDDYLRQQALIRQDAIDTSRMMAKQLIETRAYLSSVLRDETSNNPDLIPQVAATRVAQRISKETRYTLRQVSLRYRNPQNSPDQYETEQLKMFTANPAAEQHRSIYVNGARVFRYMLPMIAEKSCLECHGSFETAPAYIQQRFPKGHYSYNYTVGEVIGAVSVSIPMADLYAKIGKNVASDLLFSGGIAFLILILMGNLIKRSIITPVEQLSATLTRVARVGTFDEQLPVTGKDEISRLITAYNSMIEELNMKSIQRQESEDRYRNVIEMAQLAIVTFIEDGKMVIVNQSAERLFGLPREDLIGVSLFKFLNGGDGLKREIAMISALERPGEVPILRQQLTDVRGESREVEMSLSATLSQGRQMFTVIIREAP